MKSLNRAAGFQLVRKDGEAFRYERHRVLKDVATVIVEASEEERWKSTHPTRVTITVTLNRIRHPFAFGQPSMDSFLFGQEVRNHIGGGENDN